MKDVLRTDRGRQSVTKNKY